MLGGGHVRRCSLVSLMDASPCVHIEKRKYSSIQEAKAFKNVERHESPDEARIVEQSSIASVSSFQFGDDRMIMAQKGLLERQSLEGSCFVAYGEDSAGCECRGTIAAIGANESVLSMPVFTRPLPARSRSSTCASSLRAGTPPLFLPPTARRYPRGHNQAWISVDSISPLQIQPTPHRTWEDLRRVFVPEEIESVLNISICAYKESKRNKKEIKIKMFDKSVVHHWQPQI